VKLVEIIRIHWEKAMGSDYLKLFPNDVDRLIDDLEVLLSAKIRGIKVTSSEDQSESAILASVFGDNVPEPKAIPVSKFKYFNELDMIVTKAELFSGAKKIILAFEFDTGVIVYFVA